MAITGIGTDIVEISRLSRIIERYGEKFVGRVFTSDEAAYCGRAGHSCAAAAFAGRFAVKEAFYKALPGDLQPLSSWRSIQTLADDSGRPKIHVCDKNLKGAMSARGISSAHVSISHEKTHCIAVVILE